MPAPDTSTEEVCCCVKCIDNFSMSASDTSTEELSSYVKFVVVSQDCKTRIYTAGKRKLASESQVFRAIFDGLPDPKAHHVLTVTEFSPKAFKLMLRHIYGREYCLDDWKLSLEVFGMAERYQIRSLLQECEKFFAKTSVTSSNALEMYELASKYGVQTIQSACEEVFHKDMDIVLTPSFRSANKDIVKKVLLCRAHLPTKHLLALINWGMYECRRRKITISGRNVETCVLSVCGSRLACCVSALMTKLNALKKHHRLTTPVDHNSPEETNSSKELFIPLRDSATGTLISSFNVDIICELNISVLKGILKFTGIKLHLKPCSFPEDSPLEVFYYTENMVEGTGVSDVKFNDITNESEDIVFSEGLIVKSGQSGNITVGIEDMRINRCLENSSVEQSLVDYINDACFKVRLSSNQARSCTETGPFFIEKLYYRPVFGI